MNTKEKPFKVGTDFMKVIRKVWDRKIIDLIWAEGEETELIDKFSKDGVEIKKHA